MAALHPHEQREQRERLPCAGCPSGLSRDRLQHRRRASLCASCHPPALRPLTRRRASPRAAAIRAPVAGPPAGASCAAVSCTRGADAPCALQRASPSRCARRRRCFSHARAPRSRPPVRHRAPLSAPHPCPRACAARASCAHAPAASPPRSPHHGDRRSARGRLRVVRLRPLLHRRWQRRRALLAHVLRLRR